MAALMALPVEAADAADAADGTILIREALVLGGVGRVGRSPVHRDSIELRIVKNEWKPPQREESMPLSDGSTRVWESVSAKPDGAIEHAALRGAGYASAIVEVPDDAVWILQASGHNLVYVNGTLRTGDPYQYGYVHLPVLLKAGSNELLFQCSRGRLQARLVKPKGPLFFHTADTTFPDLIAGEREPLFGAVIVLNATTNFARTVHVQASGPGAKKSESWLVNIPPLGLRKVPFQLLPPMLKQPGEYALTLSLHQKDRKLRQPIDEFKVKWNIRKPADVHKRTFVSGIDGSVQYYAVNPAHPPLETEEPLALFLSLHGASVEATSQAAAYSHKRWGHIICPTNRRPYGFDWEEWGQLDALEVLDLAKQRFQTDPRRVYLTGHSMGGHGTWNLGATFPDRFAALGPSAGWISFNTYGGRRQGGTNVVDSPMDLLLRRAAAMSDTLALASNYLHHGIYVLHGDADDNVPVTQARTMKETLAKFHRDFDYFEQPGAGHWWESSDEPGAECMDWPAMYDLFSRRSIPRIEDVRRIHFTTVNPGVSARSHWIAIEAQIAQLKPSSVDAQCDPGRRRFTARTENVHRLALTLDHLSPGEPVNYEIDGQKLGALAWPAAVSSKGANGMPTQIWFSRRGAAWFPERVPSPALKGPARHGPFKQAFQNRMLFVFGTRGTAEENEWALAKARYDAETFWYRGNGSVEMVADVDLEKFLKQDRDSSARNIILYGHSESNAVWEKFLGSGPVDVRRGLVRIGEHEWKGADLACLFVRPAPYSPTALIGAVSGSGIAGLKLTDRLPYFISGVGYPDCVVIGPDMLENGSAGIRAAGFFGQDWSATTGEFVWQ
ncbi:MAG: prolyl oligopeptidase family serine peptidase [Verrucomicrobiota bacterium]